MFVRHLLYLLKSFQSRKLLGYLLPVSILFLLGGRQAYAGTNQWTGNGPYGGVIRALAIDPTNSSTLYAGTTGGGVYKSTDAGGNWSAVDTGLTNLNITSLVIDPANSSNLYVGTNAGVFKSTDGGGTWSAVNSGLSATIISALVIDPANSSNLYAAINGVGVFKTSNGGGSWSAVNTGLPSTFTHSLAIDPSSTIYVGLDYGTVYKSTNGGANWSAADTGLPGDYHNCVTVDPSNSSTLYVGGQGTGIYKSANSGGSWSAVNTGLPVYVPFGSYPAVSSLAVDPTNSSTVYAATGVGLYKSTNGGGSWGLADTGLTITGVYALAIDAANSSTLYVGTSGGGVNKSSDSAGSWSAVNNGLTNTNILSLAINPTNGTTAYAGTKYGGVLKSTDGGASWNAVNSGLTNNTIYTLAIDPANSSTIYAGTGNGVFKSTNGGGSWSVVTTALTYAVQYISLAIDPANSSTVYAGTNGNGLFKSIDGGGSWSALTTGLASSTKFLCLAIDPTNSSTLYAGTNGGGVFKSSDAGANWSAVNSGLAADPSFGTNASLAIDPTNSSTLYTGMVGPSANVSRGVYKTTSGGGIWNAANSGLPVLSGVLYPNIYSLAIDPTNSSTIYAATSGQLGGGVFKSTDGGATWSAYYNSLPNPNVLSLAIDPTNSSTLYAGTDGSGVFTITHVNSAPTATSVNITGTLNVGQTLNGNYTYSDVDGDLEGTSTFRWLRNGTTVVGTSATYTVVAADSGQLIAFEVTPVAQTGATPGNPVQSSGVTILNSAPTASNVNITGTPAVGQTLLGSYTYSDVDNDAQGTSTFRWLRNGTTVVGTSSTYTAVAADVGQSITFEVTPVAATGTSPGTPVTSSGVTILNSAPTATNVNITGTPAVGQLLTGHYTYNDVDGDLQGTSTFRWLRNGTAVLGTSSTYTVVAADSGQSITFEVTPVAATGTSPGTPVTSAGVTIPPAAATLSTPSLKFGSVVINTTSAAKTVTLSGTGNSPLSISSITASSNFAIAANTCGATLAVGKKCTVKVTFTPTSLGPLTGTLSFVDNASSSPQTVALSGTGVVPAALTPATATYVAKTVGTTSPPKTFTLKNNQAVALTGIVISTTGDFAISATTCTTSLAAKGKCTISVTFTPTAIGTRTGQLNASDSANNSPQTSNLTGRGK